MVVAEVTGLLALDTWSEKIPGLRIITGRSTSPGPSWSRRPRICWPASATSVLPAGELRDAAPKLLRFRLLHLPARLTRGQRKRWLHLRGDWPWTPT